MKIIDKYQDFYDYIQNIDRDNFYTFDRGSQSYIPDWERIRNAIADRVGYGVSSYHLCIPRMSFVTRYMIMQIHHKFWAFPIKITPVFKGNVCTACNFAVEACYEWTDFDATNELLSIQVIQLDSLYDKFVETDCIERLKEAIRAKRFYIIYEISGCIHHRNTAPEYKIAILRESVIPKFVEARAIYDAIENYFAEEKTKSEKTVADGTTNAIKIEAHGFDLKKSFRKR